MTTPGIAANAYTAAANLTKRITPDKSAETAALTRPDFGAMVTDAAKDVVASGQAAEAKSVAMMQGKANVVDVVTAVAETEVALETMVSVRDRVIAAYQEIMRMPI